MRFGVLSRFCVKAEGQEFRSLEVRGKLIALKNYLNELKFCEVSRNSFSDGFDYTNETHN